MVWNLIFVFLGGGVGSVARLLLGGWIAPNGFSSFPWATFSINVIGSFVLGVLFAIIKDKPDLYALFGIGLCGGFTTFSTFSLETLQLIQRDRADLASAYVIASVIAGVLAAWVGYRIAG